MNRTYVRNKTIESVKLACNLIIDQPKDEVEISDILASLTSYEETWIAFPKTHDEVDATTPDKVTLVSSLKINGPRLFIIYLKFRTVRW